MRLIAIAALVAVLSGCASNSGLSPTGEAVLREVAAIGVSRHFREYPGAAAKALKIRAVLAELQETEEITTVGALRAALEDRIASVSDPFDRADYTRLLNVLSPLLEQYVGGGQLAPDAVVKVRDFLGYIAAAIPLQIGRTDSDRKFDFKEQAADTSEALAGEIAQLKVAIERAATLASQRTDDRLGL